jgi:hypothetical protein
MPNLAWWYTPQSGGYFQIATVTAAGGETSLTFSSIPATYTDLQIRGVQRHTLGATGSITPLLRFNADSTAANYYAHWLEGDGTSVSAASYNATAGMYLSSAGMGDASTANCFAAMILDVADYASTSKNKTLKAFFGNEGNAASTSYRLNLLSGAWFSTAAITSITIVSNATAFKAGSTFTLYAQKAFL